MKKTPLKKQSSQPTAKLKKEAWKWFSLFIRNRDSWQCFTCGSVFKGAGMHAGHFITRTKANTFFDEMNVNAQCYPCNIHKRGNSGEYAYRLIEKYGQAKFKKLLERGRVLKQFTHTELKGIIETYKGRADK